MQPNEQQPVEPPVQPLTPPSVAAQPESPVSEQQMPASQSPAFVEQPQPAPAPVATAQSAYEQQPQPVDEAQPQLITPAELPQDIPVVWQDIEYIQHDQGPLWYVGFVSVVLVLVIGSVLLQAWTFIPLVLVMAVALIIYTHRPPRTLNYTWSAKGLTINDQLHPTGEFRSFGVIQDGVHNALVFIPVKRFRPGLTVYFPTDVGEQLVDAVGGYLPMQELHLDTFDKIIRKLRI